MARTGLSPSHPLGLIPGYFFPYYLLVIGATGILCWAAAIWLVSPIRNLTATVERFGRGDLSARWHTRRRDEIGYLARAFNETAERLQRLLTSERRLLADISHELRSPLARLKLAVRLARSSPDQGHALDRIERDVDRITSMVSELVEITRAEGDPEARKFEIVDLEQVVNDIVSEERLDAELRECRLQVSGQLEQAALGRPGAPAPRCRQCAAKRDSLFTISLRCRSDVGGNRRYFDRRNSRSWARCFRRAALLRYSSRSSA